MTVKQLKLGDLFIFKNHALAFQSNVWMVTGFDYSIRKFRVVNCSDSTNVRYVRSNMVVFPVKPCSEI